MLLLILFFICRQLSAPGYQEPSGSFDYKFPEEDCKSYWEDQTGSFLNLLREIGLKLKAANGPVETLIIDHATRPSPN